MIADENDYLWSKDFLNALEEDLAPTVWFSPANAVHAKNGHNISHEGFKALKLAERILEDKLPVRFQMQQHKILWGEQPSK